MRQDGAALCHASPELRADQETVLAAVEQDGGALFYAAKQLKADRGFVLAAVYSRTAERAAEFGEQIIPPLKCSLI